MGVLRLPSRNDYWRVSNWLMKTNFGRVMPRDTFNLIWRYLHLANNDAPVAQGDKLVKIRWFVDFLNKQFQSVYIPYGKYTVDESMIRFKGRLAFRQYLPAKPIKWGVKVWVLAESDTLLPVQVPGLHGKGTWATGTWPHSQGCDRSGRPSVRTVHSGVLRQFLNKHRLVDLPARPTDVCLWHSVK